MGLNYRFFNASQTKEWRLMLPVHSPDLPFTQYDVIQAPTTDPIQFYKYFDQFEWCILVDNAQAQATDPTTDEVKIFSYIQNAGSAMGFKPETGSVYSPVWGTNTEPYDGTGAQCIDLVGDGPWYNGDIEVIFSKVLIGSEYVTAVDVYKAGQRLFGFDRISPYYGDNFYAIESEEAFINEKKITRIDTYFESYEPTGGEYPFALRRAYKENIVLDEEVGPGYGSHEFLQLCYKLITQTDIEPFEPEEDPYEEPEGETGGHPVPPISGGITSLPLPTYSLSGYAYNLYQMTPSQLYGLMQDLWDETWLEDLLDTNEYKMSNIVSLHILPFTRGSGTSSPIKLGNKTSSQGNLVSEYQQIDLGSVKISKLKDNYLMHEPFSNVEIYLPYCGMISLVPSKVTDRTIKVLYNVHIPTGYAIASIWVDGILYSTHGCNMATQCPIASNGNSTLMSGIGSLINFAAEPSIGAGLDAISSLGKAAQGNTSTKGSYGSAIGFMNLQKPYIIRSYPNMIVPPNSGRLMGKPTYKFGKIKEGGSGFIRVDKVKLDGIQCSNTVKALIEADLQRGVYW